MGDSVQLCSRLRGISPKRRVSIKAVPPNPYMMKASVAKNIRQVLKFILFFGLGLFIIWLFQRNMTAEEKAEIGEAFRGAEWGLVVMVAVFGLLSNVFRTLRWNMLLSPLGFKPRFHNTFLSVLVAYFANLAIPRLGEVMRCTFMYRYERIPVEKSLGTVVSERVIDMLCFLLIFVLSFCIEYKALHTYVEGMFNRNVDAKVGVLFWVLVVVLALVLVAVGFVLYYRRHKESLSENSWLRKIAKVFRGFGEGFLSLRHLRHPWLFVLWSLGIWICYWLMSYCAFHSLEALSDTGLGIALIALAMGTIGVMLTPGGIGVYPVIISETLSVFGIAKTLGYTAGWISWGAQTLIIIIGGILALCLLPLINGKRSRV